MIYRNEVEGILNEQIDDDVDNQLFSLEDPYLADKISTLRDSIKDMPDGTVEFHIDPKDHNAQELNVMADSIRQVLYMRRMATHGLQDSHSDD